VALPALRRWGWRALIALGLGALFGFWAAAPGLDILGRLSVDLLLPLRHLAFGPLFPPAQSDVVVVAIDEETYRTPPFVDTPKVAWTPHLAQVIGAIDAAGPRVIGLDHVFPTSLDRNGMLRGYDRPFLLALRQAGRAGRMVLGEVRLSREMIRPYVGQIRAVGGADHLRLLNLRIDVDDVVRLYPAGFTTEDGGRVASFGVELARRAGADAPADDFLINYNTGPNDIPTFNFADLWACADRGDAEFFARQFADKIVLIGEVADLEDRRYAAKRFAMARNDPATWPRCVNEFDPQRFGEIVDRRSIPGIYIHAAAINTLTKGLPLRLTGRAATFALIACGVALLAALFFLLDPVWGAVAGAVVLAAGLAGAVGAIAGGLVLPVVAWLASGLLTYTAVYAYRVGIEDRAKRRIKHAFKHYLAPTLVERLADDPAALHLGGERRRITVLFSDIAGFTAISESMREQPETLVEVLNRYLTVMCDAIESCNGYVDKFIGDAVMAIWNAPLGNAAAERDAVEAALRCLEGLDKFNREVVAGEFGLPPIGTRIGINTGEAVVGNMGSATRLNYTVTGDPVNLAARLEAANKTYGSVVMVAEDTARRLGRAFVLRRLDRLVVKGKTLPAKVYEVIGRAGEVPAERLTALRAYNRAMALYYRRDFAAARDGFAALSEADTAARLYVGRCEHFLQHPPPPDWDGTFEMTTKE
jgi:class 3 adenylate cyclase/CHASE2 domain-containing sensor protein